MNAQKPVASVFTPVGCRISVAVSSVEALMKTSEKPAISPGASTGSVIRASTDSRPCPSERATSSSPGGACAIPARTATSASGKNMIA